MRIFLTGFMAAGKSTVGRLLADRAELGFVDLDMLIEERAGREVWRIFEAVGEGGFRGLERLALEEVVARDDVVVATGGGTMVAAANRQLMRETGVTVWLDPPFEVLSARLRDSERPARPLFLDSEQARDLYLDRRSVYERADLRIEIGADEPPEEVASRILGQLSKTPCAT